MVSPIGLGTVKIGRTMGLKYPQAFELPDDDAVMRLLDIGSDLGINLLDTAPAYGKSEARLGEILKQRGDRDAWVISTKAGERFEDGESRFDFSAEGIIASCERSLVWLATDRVDCLLLHSDGLAEAEFGESGAFDALDELKARGLVRAVGVSVKTASGALVAAGRSDVLMIEYSLAEPGMGGSITRACERGAGVFVKKALASGRVGDGHGVSADEAFGFVFAEPGVTSVVVGTLNPEHLRENCRAAERAIGGA